MSNHEELVKALRERQGLLCYGEGACPENCELLMNHGCYTKLHMDAAAAIEALEAEVERLKDANDELREKQTYIDKWGTRWGTSAKDVPDSAYKHGYADGKYEALTLEECIDRLHELGWLQEHDRILSQPHWVSVEEPPKEEGRYWCAKKFAGHWIFFAAWYWNNVSDYTGVPVGEEEKADGFVLGEDVVDPDYWMPIEPPKEA